MTPLLLSPPLQPMRLFRCVNKYGASLVGHLNLGYMSTAGLQRLVFNPTGSNRLFHNEMPASLQKINKITTNSTYSSIDPQLSHSRISLLTHVEAIVRQQRIVCLLTLVGHLKRIRGVSQSPHNKTSTKMTHRNVQREWLVNQSEFLQVFKLLQVGHFLFHLYQLLLDPGQSLAQLLRLVVQRTHPATALHLVHDLALLRFGL